MAASIYLPLHCGACSRTRLERVEPGEVARCRRCGEAAAIVPSEAYREHDVALFERIEDALRQADLSPRDLAVTLASTSDIDWRTRAPDAVLLRILDHLPELHFLLPSLYGIKAAPLDRPALARAIGMVRAMVATRLREFETQ